MVDLIWPGCLNARDLGGLPTVDAHRVRSGALLRSDSLHKLTADGVAEVGRAGVSRIVDLRGDMECELAPNPFADHSGYRRIPIDDVSWAAATAAGTLGDYYLDILQRVPGAFADAVAAIADALEGAVLVHCTAGQDRTGMVIGLTLASVGVDPMAIAEDYARTELRFAPVYAAYDEAITDPELRDSVAFFRRTPADYMRQVLAHVDAEHGGAFGYLRSGGLSSDHVSALRERLLEPAPS